MKITITGGGKATDVTQYVTTVTWNGDYQSCARTLSFGILSSPTDRTIEKVRCDLMDAVAFDHNGRIFDGYIFRREKSTNESEITITCFDKGFYLRKITASYKFTRTTPETITRRVCADYGIQTGSIARTGFTLSRNFLGKIYTILSKAPIRLPANQLGENIRSDLKAENFRYKKKALTVARLSSKAA